YLTIITLGFGEIIRVIVENISITGGAQGLRSIPKLATVNSVMVITVLIIIMLFTLIRSRHGRAISSIREDEIAADASGIPTTFYKIFAFAFAAFLAGVAGGIYAQYLGILGAKTFGFMRSIEIVVMVVLGGMGSFTGSILSAGVLTYLPEALRGFSEYRMVVYSLALILIMIFRPKGLMGRYEFSLTRAIDGLIALIKRFIAFLKKKPQDAKTKED
ncbi:MAG: branched-chain amino acid ABC transporter permease, partial [Oscillospiraceae bacterium]|nr:branched-chain amino acid ABC transporter permease [Oscillospiraceae bacterium]